jgi:CheY-like chemotaxis protein
MPGMSGLELLPKAKALRPDLSVIMITAYGDAETKRKALENGAEALLTKPIDFAMLRNDWRRRGGLSALYRQRGATVSLPKWPHPLSRTTLLGKAGWRGRQPHS